MDAWAIGVGLVALRWWALLQVQVLWRQAIGPAWTAVAAGLALVLALGVSAPEPAVAGDLGVAALMELGLGGLMGLVVALPGHALVGASQASARVLGTAPGPWRAITLCLVAGTALALDLHQPLLVAGQDLYAAWPTGQWECWAGGLGQVPVARLAHATMLLTLTLATPALLAGAVAELAIRAVGRGPAAVAAGVDTVAPWLRVAAALVATGASWAAYDAVWAERVVAGIAAG